MKPIYIIIPTFNSIPMLLEALRSIINGTVEYYRLIVVNNGAEELSNYITGDIKVLHTGTNLGWAGGINYALKEIEENDPFGIGCDNVLLANDDILIPPNDRDWLHKLRMVLDDDPKIAAVGPTSNVVAGWQNIRNFGLPDYLKVKFLIGFTVLMRRQLFMDIGAMDESLPGGDDLDWSIRFRKEGYGLVVRRNVYIHHHGFVTGTKVHGGPEQKLGWNSPDFTDNTNIALIKKHGFKEFINTARNAFEPYDAVATEYGDSSVLSTIAVGTGLDIGCGFNKIQGAVGVDIKGKGEALGEYGTGEMQYSDADIKTSGDNLYMIENNSQDYIVARHNIEHYANPVKTLREWHRVLKPGGKLGLITPDDSKLSSMRLDPTHKHSFSRDCMRDLLAMTGFKVEELGGTENQWDFYVIAHKNGKHE